MLSITRAGECSYSAQSTQTLYKQCTHTYKPIRITYPCLPIRKRGRLVRTHTQITHCDSYVHWLWHIIHTCAVSNSILHILWIHVVSSIQNVYLRCMLCRHENHINAMHFMSEFVCEFIWSQLNISHSCYMYMYPSNLWTSSSLPSQKL